MKRLLAILILVLAGSALAQGPTTDRWGAQDLRYGGSWTRTYVSGSTVTMYGNSPLNIIGFGAKPDDGIDDTTYIQAAVDSAEAWGAGTVFIPSGTFSINAAITIDSDDVSIVGCGESSVISRDYSTHTSRVINIEDASNILLSNFTIDGNSNTTTFVGSGSGHGIRMTGDCSSILIDGVKIFDMNTDGIYVGGATDVPDDIKIVNSEIYNCNRNGITIIAGNRVVVANNTVYNNYGVGIDAEPNVSQDTINNLTISNNIVSNSRTTGMGSGLDFFPRLIDVTGDNAYVNNVVVSSNILDAKLAATDSTGTFHSVLAYISQLGSVNFSNNILETNRSSDQTAYGALYLRDWETLSGSGNIVKSRGVDAAGEDFAIKNAVTMVCVGDTLGPVDFGVTVSGSFDYAVYADSVLTGSVVLNLDNVSPPNNRSLEVDLSPNFSILVNTPYVHPSSTAPDTASFKGRLWYDSSTDLLKLYDGTRWNTLSESRSINFPMGTETAAGWYDAAGFIIDAADTSTFSAPTTYGTANSSYAAHFYIVVGDTILNALQLTVTGTSITDAGVRAEGATDTIDLNGQSPATSGMYYETDKKWIGQVSVATTIGDIADDEGVNYGFIKYWDNNNTDFTISGCEAVGRANATDADFDLRLCHIKATGWTWALSGATPPVIKKMSTVHGTERSSIINQPFAWKHANLSTAVDGSGSEGILFQVWSKNGADTVDWGYFSLVYR